jgi:hypothetical protein
MVDSIVRIRGLFAGKKVPDVFASVQSGDLQLVKDHVLVDAGCVSKKFK